MADRLLLLLQAAPVLSPSGSLSSSSSSSIACYKEGGCISDYVAVALTALVSLMSVSSPHPPYRHHMVFFLQCAVAVLYQWSCSKWVFKTIHL